MAHTVA